MHILSGVCSGRMTKKIVRTKKSLACGTDSWSTSDVRSPASAVRLLLMGLQATMCSWAIDKLTTKRRDQQFCNCRPRAWYLSGRVACRLTIESLILVPQIDLQLVTVELESGKLDPASGGEAPLYPNTSSSGCSSAKAIRSSPPSSSSPQASLP